MVNDAVRPQERTGPDHAVRTNGAGGLFHGRRDLTLILAAALLWSILQVDWGGDLVHPGGLEVLGQLVGGLLTPDLSPTVLAKALAAAWITVTYAVAGLTLGIAAGLPLGVLASGVLIRRSLPRRAAMLGGRTVLAAARAIHELVWVWLFVAAIGLSPFAAILALAIPYAGILGRIYADLLNDVPEAPLHALATTGAGPAKQLFYVRLPMAFPDMLSYTFYRFECALRSSAVMSFVGLGGLGYQTQLALDDLHYHQVGTYLAALVLLVVAVDSWSGLIRRRLTA